MKIALGWRRSYWNKYAKTATRYRRKDADYYNHHHQKNEWPLHCSP